MIEKKGDIFFGAEDVLVHGCNCFHTMGAGIAFKVKCYYPLAYSVDLKTKRGDKSKLGTYSHVSMPHYMFSNQLITVINAYTQYRYGRDQRYLDYDALRTVMENINKDFPTQTICMPKIGCYNAGGEWAEVKSILLDVFGDREIVVYSK